VIRLVRVEKWGWSWCLIYWAKAFWCLAWPRFFPRIAWFLFLLITFSGAELVGMLLVNSKAVVGSAFFLVQHGGGINWFSDTMELFERKRICAQYQKSNC